MIAWARRVPRLCPPYALNYQRGGPPPSSRAMSATERKVRKSPVEGYQQGADAAGGLPRDVHRDVPARGVDRRLGKGRADRVQVARCTHATPKRVTFIKAGIQR